MRTGLVTVLVLVLTIGSVNAQTNPRSVLGKVEEKLKPVLADLSPPPTIEYPRTVPSLVISYQPQIFKVQPQQTTGRAPAGAGEITGPSPKGFILRVYLEQAGLAGNPQTNREPYWTAIQDRTTIAGTAKQAHWTLLHGSQIDPNLVQNLTASMRSLAVGTSASAPASGINTSAVSALRAAMVKERDRYLLLLRTTRDAAVYTLENKLTAGNPIEKGAALRAFQEARVMDLVPAVIGVIADPTPGTAYGEPTWAFIGQHAAVALADVTSPVDGVSRHDDSKFTFNKDKASTYRELSAAGRIQQVQANWRIWWATPKTPKK